MDPAETRSHSADRGPRVAAAVLAALVALGSAYGMSQGLRRKASLGSHQQMTPEDWLGAPAPASPALVSQGRAAFLSSCAHCHGVDASGDEGPDLHRLEASDRYISRTILRGVKGEMPSFGKKLGYGDIVRLTAYIRSLK